MTRLRSIVNQIHKKHFEKHRQNKDSVKKIDRTMATIGILGPAFTSLQIFHIFSTRAVSGLSPITWIGYTTVSLCWVLYGFFYKDKPLVIVNTLSSLASATVFVGYIMFH